MPALISARASSALILTAVFAQGARPGAVRRIAWPAFRTQPRGDPMRLPAGLPASPIDEEALLPEDAAIMPAEAACNPLLR